MHQSRQNKDRERYHWQNFIEPDAIPLNISNYLSSLSVPVSYHTQRTDNFPFTDQIQN